MKLGTKKNGVANLTNFVEWAAQLMMRDTIPTLQEFVYMPKPCKHNYVWFIRVPDTNRLCHVGELIILMCLRGFVVA